jgi:hypothetical protein
MAEHDTHVGKFSVAGFSFLERAKNSPVKQLQAKNYKLNTGFRMVALDYGICAET